MYRESGFVPYMEFGIEVRDAMACIRFYRDALGLEPFGETVGSSRRLYGLRLGGAVVKLMWEEGRTWTQPPVRAELDNRFYGFFHLTLKVLDGAHLTRRCAALGYEVVVDWTPSQSGPDAGQSGYSYVRDPEGNLVHLVTGSIWGPVGTELAGSETTDVPGR